jgi:Putative zinc-binding metallo-peptidase
MTEQRLSDMLDELGLADCLARTDGDGRVSAVTIATPGEIACIRAVESFSNPSSLLRHQVGHRLWERLVGQSDHVATFWLVFGGRPIAKQVKPLRASHPMLAGPRTHSTSAALEQWAEAFDTYMLILDIAATAAERGLLVLGGPYDPIALPFAAIFDHALPYLGSIPASTCDGSARKGVRVTANKLTFVHRRVSAHSERARFYSLD